ncbi:MAG: sensor histidine kinase, partial [SAR202 cluster bacterium]|nr:sensor histidine kinase [SAR202 cluster bacterium]
ELALPTIVSLILRPKCVPLSLTVYTLAQEFTGIVLQLEAGEQALADDPAEVQEHLDRARNLAKHCLQEARRSVWNLLPQALEDTPLHEALQGEVHRFNLAGDARANFALSGDRRQITGDIQAALFRICQESLTNIRKHAAATEVSVSLAFQRDAVRLEIEDNGKGFDVSAPRSRGTGGGFGVNGMQQRARLLRGELTVTSQPGAGAKVEVTIPTV